MCRVYIYFEQLVFGNLVAACVLQARPRRSPTHCAQSSLFTNFQPKTNNLMEIAKLVDKPWEVLAKGGIGVKTKGDKQNKWGQTKQRGTSMVKIMISMPVGFQSQQIKPTGAIYRMFPLFHFGSGKKLSS